MLETIITFSVCELAREIETEHDTGSEKSRTGIVSISYLPSD